MMQTAKECVRENCDLTAEVDGDRTHCFDLYFLGVLSPIQFSWTHLHLEIELISNVFLSDDERDRVPSFLNVR